MPYTQVFLLTQNQKFLPQLTPWGCCHCSLTRFLFQLQFLLELWLQRKMPWLQLTSFYNVPGDGTPTPKSVMWGYKMIYPHSLQIQPECSVSRVSCASLAYKAECWEISVCWTNLRDAATQGKALKKLVEWKGSKKWSYSARAIWHSKCYSNNHWMCNNSQFQYLFAMKKQWSAIKWNLERKYLWTNVPRKLVTTVALSCQQRRATRTVITPKNKKQKVYLCNNHMPYPC